MELLFTDNFNTGADLDTTNWTEVSGTWSLYLNRAKLGSSGGGTAIYKGLVSNNQSVEADLRVDGGVSTNISGLVGRYNSTTNNTYYLGEIDWANNKVQLQKSVSGTLTLLASKTVSALTFNTNYKLKLECDKNSIMVWFEDELVLGVTDTSISSGKVGLLARASSASYPPLYDNFRVISLSTPTQGFMLPNNIFRESITTIPNTFLTLNTIQHNPVRGTWETAKLTDPRIENYNTWMYPFMEGRYYSKVIDLGKIYYDVQLKIKTDVSQRTTNYTTDSLQMNQKGRVFLDISGKCNILPSRTKYKDEFGKLDPYHISDIKFNHFWVDNTATYIYISSEEEKYIQKRRFSDLEFVAEIDNTDIGITLNDDEGYSCKGICGDSTYIYYIFEDWNTGTEYVVKRRQSDLGYIKKVSNINGALSAPQGIWCDNTNLFICDKLNSRVLKADLELVWISPQFTPSNFTPTEIWGDATRIFVVNTHTSDKSIKRILKSDMATFATSTLVLNSPQTIYGDSLSNLYVTDYSYPNSTRIIKMNTSFVYDSEKSYLGKNNEKTFNAGGFGYYDATNSKLYISYKDIQIIDAMNTNLTWDSEKKLPQPSMNYIGLVGITGDSTHIYIADEIYERIVKIDRGTLEPIKSVLIKDLLPDIIRVEDAIVSDTDYLYGVCIRFGYTGSWLYKIRKDTLTIEKIAQMENAGTYYGASYGGITISGNYIYTSYGFPQSKLAKWNKSDLSYVASNNSPTNAQMNYPHQIWCDGTNLFITNGGILSGQTIYSISTFKASDLSFNQSYEFSQLNPAYGIYGDGVDKVYVTTNSNFGITPTSAFVAVFTYNINDITDSGAWSGDINKSGVVYDHKFGEYGYAKNKYKDLKQVYIDADYIYFYDAGNRRIIRQKKGNYYRVELTSDDSAYDKLPVPVDGYYENYTIMLMNHPELSQKNSKRKVTSYKGNNFNIRINSEDPWDITQELNNIKYKMVYKSKYWKSPKHLYKKPVIKVKTSSTSLNMEDKSWEEYATSKIFDEIRYLRIRTAFSIKDHQTNVELSDLSYKVILPQRTDNGNSVTISSGGTKIYFNKRFNEKPDINLSILSSTAKYMDITEIDLSTINYPPYGGFTIKIFDNSGVDVGGTINNWNATGF